MSDLPGTRHRGAFFVTKFFARDDDDLIHDMGVRNYVGGSHLETRCGVAVVFYPELSMGRTQMLRVDEPTARVTCLGCLGA